MNGYKLIKHKYQSQYTVFWRSLGKLIDQVTQKRNEIVHWRAGIHPEAIEIRLTPPYLHIIQDMEDAYLNTQHLNDFINKCGFISSLLYGFNTINDKFYVAHMKPEGLKAWREVYQNEVVYPPADNHPIYQRGREFTIPPLVAPE